ncbi:hypothetical protein [Candidatus Entotheonella palauensis]|uniref:hypothetical protein n=1 Tax=Candidatus Entotheonella palauensis TaxID=93172 RepID=UPI000B7F5155|nr:hypothetical protein [Candidatus Entotheonella palauensis]
MRIYPGMKAILDLTDRTTVESNLSALHRVFTAGVLNPHYMPVSRDLSPQKIDVIVRWIEQQMGTAGA